MNFKFLKFLEFAIIILEFIFCLLTSVYCSFCISDINTIMIDADYKYYFADFKKKFQLFHTIEFSDHFDEIEDEILIGKYYNMTCVKTEACVSQIISSNLWKNKYFEINKSKIGDYANTLLNFEIISVEEECPHNYNECFKGEYYKTCIYFELSCPITAILNKETREFEDEEKLFYNLKNKDIIKNEFIKNGNFSEIKNNTSIPLIISGTASGIPIVSMTVSYEQPCKLGYLIKSKIFIEHFIPNSKYEIGDDNLYKFKVSILNCSNFLNYDKEIPKDFEGDYQLDTFYKNIIDNSLSSNLESEYRNFNSEIYDLRYIKVDSYNIEDHLKILKLISGKENSIMDQAFNENLNINLYVRKLFYAKDECTLDFYKIFTLLDVDNLAQIRVLLLRYLNWAAIDFIFLIFFVIYIRGFYLCKKIYFTKIREGKKFKQQTNLVDKYLHIFIVIIKLISALVTKFVYFNHYIQNKIEFYEDCVTDAYTFYSLKNILNIILDLKKSTNIIAFVTLITFIIDVALTIYLHYRNRRKNLELKKRAKALK